ncbi:lactadherin-like isoform X1 [Styela clava]
MAVKFCSVMAVCIVAQFLSTAASSTTTAPQNCNNVGPCRTGKRGPIGPRGLPGVAGNCSCNQSDQIELQKRLETIEDHVFRIRRSSPDTYCLLGMKDGTIPDNAISVSSRENSKDHGRLDQLVDGWHPSSNHASRTGREWIMADLGKVKTVTGVVTQGRHNSNNWVLTFKVEHSVDGRKFYDILKEDRSELVRIFDGNKDRSTKVINRFPNPVQARFVRIYPLTFVGYAFIRFDVIDC